MGMGTRSRGQSIGIALVQSTLGNDLELSPDVMRFATRMQQLHRSRSLLPLRIGERVCAVHDILNMQMKLLRVMM